MPGSRLLIALDRDIAVFRVKRDIRSLRASLLPFVVYSDRLAARTAGRMLSDRLDRGRAHYIGSVMAARRQTAPRNEIGNAIDTLERAEATAREHTHCLSLPFTVTVTSGQTAISSSRSLDCSPLLLLFRPRSATRFNCYILYIPIIHRVVMAGVWS